MSIRRVLAAIVTAAVFSLVASTSVRADLISDPGFEGTGAGPWTEYTSNPGFTMDFDSTAEAYNGSQSLMVSWSSDIPAWNVAVAEQNLSVSESLPFSASVYAKITTELDNPCFSYLETIFFDASWGEVGAHLQSAKLYQVADWTLLSNDGVVPVDAVTARVRLVTFNEDGVSSAGTVYWDDAFAEVAIPEPSTCLLLGLSVAGLMVWRKRRF